MGNASSSAKKQAEFCTFNKTAYTELGLVLLNAMSVEQAFAAALQDGKSPERLAQYPKYSGIAEAVFNGRRNETIPELTKVDERANSLNDVYMLVNAFKADYERSSDSVARYQKLLAMFSLTSALKAVLVNELVDACNAQGAAA